MTIASYAFLAFSLVVVLAYNLHPGVAWRKWVLLIANLCFLSTFSHNPVSFIPLACFLLFGFLAVRAMQRSHRQSTFVWTLAGMLLAFFWLKKYTILPEFTFLRFAYTTLGLSYIFFRVMHLIIDSHNRDLDRNVGFLSYLNYTLSFTTLVSGPIQRYPEFIDQHLALERPPLTIIDTGNSLERIVVGFFKVSVLSLVLSLIQNHAIGELSASQPLGSRILTAALVAASYPFYLYCNFSGYTDMVIGIARFLRIVLPENFDRPFSSLNFLEFWGRWHMTLSSWLKTYVYNPLLMTLMRKYPSRAVEPFLGVIAFFVTFFLIGYWHGRTSEFIFYGVLLAVGVSVNKLYQLAMARALGRRRYRALANNWIYQSFSRGLNFVFFCFYLLWFWSNWKDIGSMNRALGLRAQLLMWLMIWIVSTILLAAWELLRNGALNVQWRGAPLVRSRYVRTVWDTVLALLLVVVMELLSLPAPDLVYKAF